MFPMKATPNADIGMPIAEPHDSPEGAQPEPASALASLIACFDRFSRGNARRPCSAGGKYFGVKEAIQNGGVCKHRQDRADQHRDDQLVMAHHKRDADRNHQAVPGPESRRGDRRLDQVLSMDRAVFAKESYRDARDDHGDQCPDNGRVR